MNILPKKRWHVRTKDNIARVRRDEAAAREEEEKRQQKLELAESEARINFLRKKSGLPERQKDEEPTHQTSAAVAITSTVNGGSQHVDLFADYKTHVKTTNKELEREKKEEREKYEKQIGYLTYLGQDTNEALKLRSWYEVAPKRAEVGESAVVEKDLKNKYAQDPLTLISALLPPEKGKVNTTHAVPANSLKRAREETVIGSLQVLENAKRPKLAEASPKKRKKHKHEKKKHKEKLRKKEKKHKKKKDKYRQNEVRESESQQHKRDMLERLRKERLQREATERARQEALLAPKEAAQPVKDAKSTPMPRIVQKYNSQFNPELAKQNMI